MTPEVISKDYKIIRSRRRTLGLEIKPDASLVVRAPQHMAEKWIREFIHEKWIWIQRKQETVRKRSQEILPKQFTDGENFLYLGADYPLRIVPDNGTLLFSGQAFHLSENQAGKARECFVTWYKSEALRHISERVERYAVPLGFRYRSLGISNARTRWGSCGFKGTLNFSWRLILAPLRVVDYVVVHELVHLDEKNHSRRFWSKVENILPDYREDERWLKNRGHRLAV